MEISDYNSYKINIFLQTGLWSGMPHIFRWLFSFGFSIGCDYLVKNKIMSITNVRKLASSFCKMLFTNYLRYF